MHEWAAQTGGAEIRHDGKVLPDGQTGLVDLLAYDGIGLTQRLEAVAGRWHGIPRAYISARMLSEHDLIV